jgi:hypothetical protein
MVLRAFNTKDGTEVDPAPGLHGICLECDKEVFSKMYNPDYRHSHFSHYKSEGNDVCPGDKWDKKSEWHYNWQKSLSPPDVKIEVRIKCDNYLKRADIQLKNGRVVEVQRSSMPSLELLHREKFYGDMFWIIHPDLSRRELWLGYSDKTFLMDISAAPLKDGSIKIDGLCIGQMLCNREENCLECPRFIQKDDFIQQCLKDCIHPQTILDERIKILDDQKMKIELERRNLELEKRKRIQLWEDAQRKTKEDRVLLSEQWKAQKQKKLEIREKTKQAQLRKLEKERERKQNELKNNNPEEKRKEWDEKDKSWRSWHEKICGIN